MDNDFSPFETFQYALRRWWLVVLLILAGALLGWLAFRLGQPRYESRVAITFSLDFSRSGILTDVEIDHTIEAAGDLLSSSAVADRVVAAAAAQGVAIDAAALKAVTQRERTANTWLIHVSHADPAVAALLANLWGEHGFAHLTAAYTHALAADSLFRYQSSLESCLAGSAAVEPASATCGASLQTVLAQVEATGAELRREKLAAQGLLPGLGFSWTEHALPAQRPLRYGQGTLILAGMLIGLVVSIFAIQTRVLDCMFRKRRHA